MQSLTAGRCGGAAWWTWQRNAFSRICRIYETEDEYGEQTVSVRHRRSLRFLAAGIWCRTGEDFNVENDLLASDDTPYLCRADISGNDNIEWRPLSSWIIASGSLNWTFFSTYYLTKWYSWRHRLLLSGPTETPVTKIVFISIFIFSDNTDYCPSGNIFLLSFTFTTQYIIKTDRYNSFFYLKADQMSVAVSLKKGYFRRNIFSS